MQLSTWLKRLPLLTTLSLATLVPPQVAHAGGVERFPPGTTLEAAIGRMNTPNQLRAELAVNIGKVMSHPAVKRVKEKLDEAGIQCTLINLWLAAYKSLADSAYSPMGLLSVQGIESDIRRLERMADDWCDDKGGGRGADVVSLTMKQNGIKLHMPYPDAPGEARVVSSRAADIYQGLMAMGVIVRQVVTSTGSSLVAEGVPSGAFLLINPKYLYDPTKKTDVRQGL